MISKNPKQQIMPTATVHQIRLRLFQATRRPKHISREIVTAWGKVRVVGKLGQTHADLLEAMLKEAERKAFVHDTDGNTRIKLLVDPAKAKKTARQRSGSTLKCILQELMSALIEIMEPEELRCIGHLIDHVDIATRRDGTHITRPNPLGGEREMWRVIIGQAAMRLIEQDLRLYYNPAPIARLRHGISQAVARMVLSHNTQKLPKNGWKLDTLLQQVCGHLTPGQLRDRRREVRADAQYLAKLGIVLELNTQRIYYKSDAA
ncbi:hypothetical protein SAMN02746041_03214 [Desulfacinum hydrothermale DSM 13146]|uniref:Uncharacterized protein n=1 Tax=Desulfacinum hydrothermale DSM 13146 TaxID=1121390 RepID=A0A1W1XWK3_9BACT|nr:hypothetical protein [Desulfacinum hydrothermale]SMC28257.1 hypothetical protein SAMN02746041_03214 [Desulfacinum hydrothermale DSM 13146]